MVRPGLAMVLFTASENIVFEGMRFNHRFDDDRCNNVYHRVETGYRELTSMTTVRKTITLTSQQDQWVKAQIAAGRFTNDSEYIRDLIRRDRERNTSFAALQAAIQEGLESGVSERTAPEIAEEAEARLRRDGRL